MILLIPVTKIRVRDLEILVAAALGDGPTRRNAGSIEEAKKVESNEDRHDPGLPYEKICAGDPHNDEPRVDSGEWLLGSSGTCHGAQKDRCSDYQDKRQETENSVCRE